MKIYTVLEDARENPNSILITTVDRGLAQLIAVKYIKFHNIGEDDIWENEKEFDEEIQTFKNIDDFIGLYVGNSWVVTPDIIETELDQ